MLIKDAVFVYHLQEPEELVWHGRHHLHGPGEFEIHYFLEGEGFFHNGGKTYQLKPGNLFISPPGEYHRIEASSLDHPITYYAVLLQLSSGEDEPAELLYRHLPWQKSYPLGDRYRFFFEELRERALSVREPLRHAAVHQLLSFLYLLAGETVLLQPDREDNRHIEKALIYLQKRVFRKTSLSQVAAHLGLSEEHLIRLFQRKLRITPMRYLTRLRIEAATSMLISSSLYVYQIAEKLKFHSEFHFSKVFKRYTGLSPRLYRDRYRQLIGASREDQSIIYMNQYSPPRGLPGA
jgi:AraC-like DNA-binding protein